MPSHIVLHWDGKVIKYENPTEYVERLAIVLNSPQLEQHTRYLAAPQIPHDTGASMKDALMTTLNVWDEPANNNIIYILSRVALLAMCLTADTCLTADPGVVTSIQAGSYAFIEIDHGHSPPFS